MAAELNISRSQVRNTLAGDQNCRRPDKTLVPEDKMRAIIREELERAPGQMKRKNGKDQRRISHHPKDGRRHGDDCPGGSANHYMGGTDAERA